MTEQEIQALLSQPNHAIVGVNRVGGGPQLTPVWYAWDGVSFVFTTTRDRAKYGNIKRNAHISLLVDDPTNRTYVVAYGRAEIIEQHIGEGVRSIIQKYVAADQVDRRVKAITDDPTRVLVIFHPEKFVFN